MLAGGHPRQGNDTELAEGILSDLDPLQQREPPPESAHTQQLSPRPQLELTQAKQDWPDESGFGNGRQSALVGLNGIGEAILANVFLGEHSREGQREGTRPPSVRLLHQVSRALELRVQRSLASVPRNTSRGRIVNMGSVSGVLAAPALGPYCMSKFAFEAMSDTLRLELRL